MPLERKCCNALGKLSPVLINPPSWVLAGLGDEVVGRAEARPRGTAAQEAEPARMEAFNGSSSALVPGRRLNLSGVRPRQSEKQTEKRQGEKRAD